MYTDSILAPHQLNTLFVVAAVVVATGCHVSGNDGQNTADAATDAGSVGVDSAVTGDPGSWANPLVIDAFPYTHSGDTTAAPSDVVDSYSPCAPGTDESGGEYVYRVTIAEAGQLTATVNDVSGDAVDVDVHLLSDSLATACLARDNVSVNSDVTAGTYFLVVDTWVDGSGTALAGAFTLDVSFVAGTSGNACLTSPITCDGMASPPTVNGVPTEAAGTGGCPAGMVLVAGFCIDRYEAMLVEIQGDNSLTPWSPYANPGATRVRALSVAGVVPQGYIKQTEAAAACAEAGKRLCSNTEWLRACQGAATTTYPYGNTREDGRCNDARTCHPVVQFFESTESWIWSELGNSCINQLPDGLATTGQHATCASEAGALDMMGNLHEWTSDPAGTFRGGFYVDTMINGEGCLYRTTAHSVGHWDYSTGFRCCADAP